MFSFTIIFIMIGFIFINPRGKCIAQCTLSVKFVRNPEPVKLGVGSRTDPISKIYILWILVGVQAPKGCCIFSRGFKNLRMMIKQLYFIMLLFKDPAPPSEGVVEITSDEEDWDEFQPKRLGNNFMQK